MNSMKALLAEHETLTHQIKELQSSQSDLHAKLVQELIAMGDYAALSVKWNVIHQHYEK